MLHRSTAAIRRVSRPTGGLLVPWRLSSSVRPGTHVCIRLLGTSPLKKPQVLILAGPTGVGKTHLSLQLAHALGGEIVSADSVQQYQGMDIGSAKVSSSIRAKVAHHCIDIASVSSPVSVEFFAQQAHAAIKSIHARGKLPIIVGGSGFYLRWLLHPGTYNETTPAMRQIAEELEADRSQPWTTKLDRLDGQQQPLLQPAGRAHFLHLLATHPQAKVNPQWVRRSLELILASGGMPPPEYKLPTVDDIRALPYDYRCFYLTCEREWLNRWTDYRCELMIQEGLLQEVIQLQVQHRLTEKQTLAAAVGYRQTLTYLSKHIFSLPPPSTFLPPSALASASASSPPPPPHPFPSQLAHAVHRFPFYINSFQSSSRSLVRQQDIWFRKEPWYQFLHLPTPTLPMFDHRVSLAALLHTAVPNSTWHDMQQTICGQLSLSESAYWNSFQWSQVDRTLEADEWNDPRVEVKLRPSTPEELLAEREAQKEAAARAALPLSALPFRPSTELTESIQQVMRAQTNLSSKEHQRMRRMYTSQLFLYGPRQKQAIEKAVWEAAIFQPGNEAQREPAGANRPLHQLRY